MPHIYQIYLVRHNGKPVYVGFTSRPLHERWKKHYQDAKRMSSFVLHQAIRKYGIDQFSIETIYTGDDWKHTLQVMEPQFITEYNTFIDNDGYNMTMGGEGNVGRKVSDETKRKMSESKKGKTMKPFSSEAKQNMSQALRGRPVSDETKRKMSESKKGKTMKPLSINHKRKISESTMGRIVSDETKRKMSESKKGISPTLEHRRKISESLKKRARSKETKNSQ